MTLMQKSRLLVLASAWALSAHAQDAPPGPKTAVEAEILDRGRHETKLFLAGQFDSLTPRMTPKFLAAIGGAPNLPMLAAQVAQQAGSETSITRELAYMSPAGSEYYRISQFTNMPGNTVTFHWAWNPDHVIAGFSITPTPLPAASTFLDYRTKTELHLPFKTTRGASWYVAWGGRTVEQNYHVTAPDQRFAYDLILVRDGKIFSGTGEKNTDYACFGEPVLAPAGGTVVQSVDTVEDNIPGHPNRLAPPGNYVVIDHGNGEYSLIAHFRSGSVRVNAGDRVAQGQQLGKCGDSGNATLPHVHYHLQTGNDYRIGGGLPIFFTDYFSDDVRVPRGEPVRGEYLRSAP